MRSWAATYHPTRRTGVVEFETVEDPASPGRKAQWISDAHAVTATAPWKQIEVLSYFSSTALILHGKWAQTGSNRRPPACKAGALTN